MQSSWPDEVPQQGNLVEQRSRMGALYVCGSAQSHHQLITKSLLIQLVEGPLYTASYNSKEIWSSNNIDAKYT